MTLELEKLLEQVKDISIRAGEKILDIYENEDFTKIVDFKADDSPLTLADKESHKIIDKALREITPEIPILSEEGAEIAYEERKNWTLFWCVDPLDGTKEFIKRNGEFTVNIALIDNGSPILGVIYTPVTNTLYYGIKGQGGNKEVDGAKTPLKVNNKTENLVAVRSKSHAAPEEEEILTKYNATDSISVGSSLKFCMVAEGKADIYYRHGPTMEWDTAAGQAVAEAAGAEVLDNDGEPFQYNKEVLRNGSFLVIAKQ